jgi:hypothetical protein
LAAGDTEIGVDAKQPSSIIIANKLKKRQVFSWIKRLVNNRPSCTKFNHKVSINNGKKGFLIKMASAGF